MEIVKNRKLYIAISIVLILLGICFMIYNYASGKGAFNYDIQFTGGTSIQVDIGKEFNNDDIISIVKEVTGQASPQVQKIGTDNKSVIIKIKSFEDESIEQEKRQALVKAISDKYEIENDSFSIENVSSTISSEMQKSAVLAVIISCIAMLIYVSFRFRDFKTGASCILALLHDALIVLACYAVFRIPLNNSFIAAILTVLGYSINASIVIFDRVRENKRRLGKVDDETLVNTSVNQSLRRSVFTSLTTFFTIAALFIFGVQSVKEFALPIVVGIICGTYSSVFIAGSLWYMLSEFKNKQVKA